MNTRSIYFRLIAWYSVLIVIVSLILGAYTYQSLKTRLHEERVGQLDRRAQQIGKIILKDSQDTKEVARRINAVWTPEASNRFIRIIKSDRSVLYVSGRPEDDTFNPDSILVPKILPTKFSTRREKQEGNSDLLIVSVPQHLKEGSFLIEMGIPTDQMDLALHELISTLLFSLPVLIFIVTGGGFYLVHRSLMPVEKMRATAEKITFGNLSSRLPIIPSGDALEQLSVTLNQMLERLEESYQQVARFSADASHELRTPLAIMRVELESLVQEKSLPQHLQERVGNVLEETEYLSRITENLFTISRMDAGEAKMENRKFNLPELLTGVAEQMLPLAQEKQIALETTKSTPVSIEGDPTRFKQVIVNLLDNAIKYTPAGGKITLRVFATPQKAYLEVSDNGIGISALALPHVFERFYRANESRSRVSTGGGLGLSIVRSIVQAHGGKVSVQSQEGNGTRITIEVPLSLQT